MVANSSHQIGTSFTPGQLVYQMALTLQYVRRAGENRPQIQAPPLDFLITLEENMLPYFEESSSQIDGREYFFLHELLELLLTHPREKCYGCDAASNAAYVERWHNVWSQAGFPF